MPVSTSVQPSSPGSRYEWTWPGRVGSGVVILRIPPGSSIAPLNTVAAARTHVLSCARAGRVQGGTVPDGAQPCARDAVLVVAEPVHRLRAPLHVLLRARLRAARGPAGG